MMKVASTSDRLASSAGLQQLPISFEVSIDIMMCGGGGTVGIGHVSDGSLQ